MSDFHFTVDDAGVILAGLEALRSLPNPQHVDQKIVMLERRVTNAFPKFTLGEVRNMCLGLELLLQDNPMDWKAEQLHKRLQSVLDAPHGPSSP